MYVVASMALSCRWRSRPSSDSRRVDDNSRTDKSAKKNETGDWSRFALAVRIYNRAINRYTIIRALSS